MYTKDIEEMRKQKFYQYLQVAGFHKEAEEWFTQHHEAAVERARNEAINECEEFWKQVVKNKETELRMLRANIASDK